MKARHAILIQESITLHNHELILRLTAIMRSNIKNKRCIFSPSTGFELWSPGTESQCTTNELCWPPFDNPISGKNIIQIDAKMPLYPVKVCLGSLLLNKLANRPCLFSLSDLTRSNFPIFFFLKKMCLNLKQIISAQCSNAMLCSSLEGKVIFIPLQHFIAPALDLMPCLPSRQRREAIKAVNPRREN